jgi:hypothetical protein
MSFVPIVPATPVEKTSVDAVKFSWSKDASTALLEEVINSGTHRPHMGRWKSCGKKFKMPWHSVAMFSCSIACFRGSTIS